MLSAACLTFLSTIQHCSALTDIQQPLNFKRSQIRTEMQYFRTCKQSNSGTSYFSVRASSCSCTGMNECKAEHRLFKFMVSPPTWVYCFLFPVALLFMFFSSDFKQFDILWCRACSVLFSNKPAGDALRFKFEYTTTTRLHAMLSCFTKQLSKSL